jgi:pimeloyl-ACP methyl ester carboxylesterase
MLAVAACGDDTGSTSVTQVEATSAPQTAATTTTSASEETIQSSDPTEVSITTTDGLALDATLYPGGGTWVVLAHMLPADKTSWIDLASRFQAEGYSVLAYNNRGYGASDGSREPFALRVDADAALGYALDNGAERLVFGGASMNGATAMDVGASYDLAAIFVLSGVPTFPSVADATASLPEVEEPILFVAAMDDGSAAGDADDFATIAADSENFVLTAGGHGTNMLGGDPELGSRIVEWVANLAG